jgi:calcineurin-like phosphoesterase family protein
MRLRMLAVTVSTALATSSCNVSQRPPADEGVTMAAAGDICGSPTACEDTSNRIADLAPDFVVTMGDLAYDDGLLSEFENGYGGGTTPQTRWGRASIKDITLPGYGNHDCYDVPRDTGATKQGCIDAVTYFGLDSKFGADIPGTSGSYHAVRGEWLIVHLNSAGGEGSGEATDDEIASQDAALQEVLEADQHLCEIVVWHHPRYSSGEHGDADFVDPWFETAYENRVDIVLNGHDHDYERFEPQDGDGNAAADGVREFVVGTGGAELRSFGDIKPNSAVRIVDWGILTMELNDVGTYSWAFLDDVTAEVDDSGSGACH